MHDYYYKFSTYLKKTYGQKVWKISLDAGLSCPNRTEKGQEGCTFCRNDSFSQMQSLKNLSIKQQVRDGIERARKYHHINKYLVYFQSSTNTFAPSEKLRKLYKEALVDENVVGISISTRPDCLSNDVLSILSDVAQETDVWIELGLQSSHNRSLEILNRGHTVEDYLDAIEKLKYLPLRICTHIMIGLPFEDEKDYHETAEFIARTETHEVKIHPLLVLKNTPLADDYHKSKFDSFTLDNYSRYAVDFLENIPPTMVIQRLTAEAPDEILVQPRWALDKLAVLNQIKNEFRKRGTYQGSRFVSG